MVRGAGLEADGQVEDVVVRECFCGRGLERARYERRSSAYGGRVRPRLVAHDNDNVMDLFRHLGFHVGCRAHVELLVAGGLSDAVN